MITLGMNHGLGLYLIPITEHLNIGRELFGLSIAFQVLFAGIGAPIFGALADRYGPGKTTLFGTLLLIISRYWMANIDNTFDLFGLYSFWALVREDFWELHSVLLLEQLQERIDHYMSE